MKLSEVFTQLSYGELSQLSVGGADAGVINTTNYAQLVSHVNLGLLALYKRFPLKEGRVTVQLSQGRLSYSLTRLYAVSNTGSAEAVKHIIDTVGAPFTEDILKVERVYTEGGYEMGLNNDAEVYACATPSASMLRVPYDVVYGVADLPDVLKTSKIEVVYRASHPLLVVSGNPYDPTGVELELPYSHLEPLLYYVASRINNPVGMTNEFHAGNSYAAKYEKACQELEMVNLRVDQGSQNTRLERAGWV